MAVVLPIVVSMGDPSGVGPDCILLAAEAQSKGARGALPPFVALGDPDVFGARARLRGSDLPVHPLAALADYDPARHGHGLAVVSVTRTPSPVIAGKPDPAHAAAIIGAIEAGVSLVHDGRARALVTAPIAKSVLTAAGFGFPGHTEFLGHLARAAGSQADPVMLLKAPELAVVPATVHIPLHAVPAALSAARIMAIARIIHADWLRYFRPLPPRIAVIGLNPHAGEAGTIGTEDRDIIAPAVAALQAEGLDVTGPHPADTMFHARARTTYDVALAMYHDQALIPVKTLAFDTAVNVTLGLPFIRTSPDHGTAFAIAGTAAVRGDSMIAAIQLAAEMATHHNTTPAALTHG